MTTTMLVVVGTAGALGIMLSDAPWSVLAGLLLGLSVGAIALSLIDCMGEPEQFEPTGGVQWVSN